MKRKILLTLLLPLSLSISGCSCHKKDDYMDRKEEQEIDIDVDEERKASSLTEDEYKDLPLYIINKLNKYNSYKAVTKGVTKTNFWFVDIDQKINATAIKGEYSYFMNTSESSAYSSYHQSYFHAGNALYKDGENDEYKVSSLEDYLNKYGLYPFGQSIEGYLVEDDAIISVSKNERKNDFSFTIKFNKDIATQNVRIQMKRFGDLDDYPEFEDIQIELIIKEDFTPICYNLISNYSASKTVETSCHQTYTVTFSSFNEDIEIPGLDDFVKGRI